VTFSIEEVTKSEDQIQAMEVDIHPDDPFGVRYDKQVKYSIALQRSIERHCREEEADESACPYHAKMLNRHLRKSTSLTSPADPHANTEDILEEALRITSGDRQNTYGPPDQDFQRTALMWSALKGVEFTAREVAMFMIALKLSRETHQMKRDNSVDIAGYARCLDICNRAAGNY
jgi:hypothetical protein